MGVSPKELMAYAIEIADTLSSVLRDRGMTQKFGAGEHVKSEGWQLAGSLLGFTNTEGPSKELPDGSFEAEIHLKSIATDRVVAKASARCGTDEATWKNKPKYARRSMAYTRAIGRVYAQNFRWIIQLAGYNPTPAEEMEEVSTPSRPAPPTRATSAADAASAAANAPNPVRSEDPLDQIPGKGPTITREGPRDFSLYCHAEDFDALKEALAARHISEPFYEAIGRELDGKPRKNLQAAIDAVKGTRK